MIPETWIFSPVTYPPLRACSAFFSDSVSSLSIWACSSPFSFSRASFSLRISWVRSFQGKLLISLRRSLLAWSLSLVSPISVLSSSKLLRLSSVALHRAPPTAKTLAIPRIIGKVILPAAPTPAITPARFLNCSIPILKMPSALVKDVAPQPKPVSNTICVTICPRSVFAICNKPLAKSRTALAESLLITLLAKSWNVDWSWDSLAWMDSMYASFSRIAEPWDSRALLVAPTAWSKLFIRAKKLLSCVVPAIVVAIYFWLLLSRVSHFSAKPASKS